MTPKIIRANLSRESPNPDEADALILNVRYRFALEQEGPGSVRFAYGSRMVQFQWFRFP